MRIIKTIILISAVIFSACGEMGESPGWELNECIQCVEGENSNGEWETTCYDNCY